MKKLPKSLEKYKEALGFFPIFCLILGIYSFTGCPIKTLTGISCPGCGMSRAWGQLLQLHFQAAFAYHPLCLGPVLFVIAYVLRVNGHPKVYRWTCVGLVAAFLLVYALRMVAPANNVVVFAPEEGLIWKLFSRLLS